MIVIVGVLWGTEPVWDIGFGVCARGISRCVIFLRNGLVCGHGKKNASIVSASGFMLREDG
jgi:hypothetical protein